MDEIKAPTRNKLIFFILTCFFFFRTAFLVPMDCFGIYSHEPHFIISIYSVTFLVLLILFSTISAFFLLTVQKNFGSLPAILCLLMLSDPLYFVLQDDNLKLLINVIILLFACYFISKKSANIKIFCPIIFLSSFILPFSVFCYTPLIVSAFIAINIKKIPVKKLLFFVLLQLCFAIFGFAMHQILYSEFALFKNVIDNFSYVDLNRNNEKLSIIPAIIPMIFLCFVFSNIFIKQNKKLEKKKIITKSEAARGIFFLDFLGILYAIIVMGFLIFDFQNICVVNSILPFFIFLMTITENTTCKNTLIIITNFINKHKLLTIGIYLLIYYMSYNKVYVCIGYPTLISYIRF